MSADWQQQPGGDSANHRGNHPEPDDADAARVHLTPFGRGPCEPGWLHRGRTIKKSGVASAERSAGGFRALGSA